MTVCHAARRLRRARNLGEVETGAYSSEETQRRNSSTSIMWVRPALRARREPNRTDSFRVHAGSPTNLAASIKRTAIGGADTDTARQSDTFGESILGDMKRLNEAIIC